MGCGQSRDVQTPVSQLGSHGSSAGDDDVVKRTWGSPAPILPSINNGKALVYEGAESPSHDDSSHDSPHLSSHDSRRQLSMIEEQSLVELEDKASPHNSSPHATPSHGSECNQPSIEDDPFPVPNVPTSKGGVAFYVGEEQPAKLPPRRLQTLNANRLSMDELLRKQREAEMRHNQHLQDKMKSSEKHNSKRRINEKKGFDKAMEKYNEIEKKLERGDEKRKSIIKQKVEKTRLHHAKVSEVRRKSVTEEALDESCNIEADTEYNKSESESWDNESIKNIYDQMDYITPVSGLVTKNTLGNESDEDFFS